jgi:hypothetical protein
VAAEGFGQEERLFLGLFKFTYGFLSLKEGDLNWEGRVNKMSLF